MMEITETLVSVLSHVNQCDTKKDISLCFFNSDTRFFNGSDYFEGIV